MWIKMSLPANFLSVSEHQYLKVDLRILNNFQTALQFTLPEQ